MKKLTKPHLILSFLLAFLTATPMFAQTLIGGTEFEPKDGTSTSFFIKDEQDPSGDFPNGANTNNNLLFLGDGRFTQDIRVVKNVSTYPNCGKYDDTKNTYLPSTNMVSKDLVNSKYVVTTEKWTGGQAGSMYTPDRDVLLANTREEEENAIVE